MSDMDENTVAVRAEQAVLGSLLLSNDALDRITELTPADFYRPDHRLLFTELRRQVLAGQRADAVTLFDALGAKVDDCLGYCAMLRQSAVSAANIRRHANIVIDRAKKRALAALAVEVRELAASHQPANVCIDQIAARIEGMVGQGGEGGPRLLIEMLGDYMGVLEARMNGTIRPVATGFKELDERLDGGLERGTLTVVAARPGMGKTAFALGLCSNVAADGGVAQLQSMEMTGTQVCDRSVAGMARVPMPWLRKPGDNPAPMGADSRYWAGISHCIARAKDMAFYIDDAAALNMQEIAARARRVKRQAGGLDLLVIDQLSFITGAKSEKSYEGVGEHTRALVALAKALDCAVVLLCQLNRDCEKRPDKRPMQADLAMSGSIEQDAAYVVFLYRDEMYNQDTPDKGICEVILGKVRQGKPGTVGLGYVGNQTRFEDLATPWRPHDPSPKARRSFGGK